MLDGTSRHSFALLCPAGDGLSAAIRCHGRTRTRRACADGYSVRTLDPAIWDRCENALAHPSVSLNVS
jgi:hypothetical protein